MLRFDCVPRGLSVRSAEYKKHKLIADKSEEVLLYCGIVNRDGSIVDRSANKNPVCKKAITYFSKSCS